MTAPPPPSQISALNDDPEEVDITNHPYTSRVSPSPRNEQNTGPTEADLRRLLRSGGPQGDTQFNPFAPPGQQAAPAGEDDPMMRMIQQMMGGMGGDPAQGGPPGEGGLPPALAAMMGGGASTDTLPANTYGYVWRIVHAIFAFTLGIYILQTFHFDGSRISRAVDTSSTNARTEIFWIFTTAELLLQSSRFFMERGKVVQGGMLGIISNFLPPPWNEYVRLVARYSGIYTTIVDDAMVVIFVLGAVAWWKGAVA